MGTVANHRLKWAERTPSRAPLWVLLSMGGMLWTLVVGPVIAAGGAGDSITEVEQAFFEPIPVVLTASRLAQPVNETPAAITVIDREMIEASGFNNIADVLRLVPGFQVAMSTLDSTYAVTYHGQSDAQPRRMEVLVDGRSVYSSIHYIDWFSLGVELEDVDRIEVVRGPNSPVYGANAFIATVNIITRQPYQDPGLYARLTTGSRDTHLGMLRHGWSEDNCSCRLSLGYDRADGFAGRNDERLVRTANFRGQLNPTIDDLIDVQLGLTNGPRGRGGDTPLLNPFGPHLGERGVRSSYQYLRWSHNLSDGRDMYVQAYHNYQRENDDASLGRLSDILGVAPQTIPALFGGHQDEDIRVGIFDHTEERYDLEWQLNDASANRLRWVVGGGLRWDRFKSRTDLGIGSADQDYSQRFFAHAAYTAPGGWVLNAGGMLEHGDLLGTELSYRLGINRVLSSSHTLRAAVTRSVRRAGVILGAGSSLALRFSNGDPIDVLLYSPGGIEPEEMIGYELGYLGSWPKRQLDLDVKLFREEIRREIRSEYQLDLPITEYRHNGAFVAVNGGGIDLTGVEGQLRWRPWPGSLISFQYAWTQARDRYDPLATGFPSREGATPRSTASLLVSQHLPHGFEASTGFYHLGAMNWGGDGATAGGGVGGYDRWDARLAKRFRWPSSELLLELIGQNIGGDPYAESRADNQFDTRYFLRASLQFH